MEKISARLSMRPGADFVFSHISKHARLTQKCISSLKTSFLHN